MISSLGKLSIYYKGIRLSDSVDVHTVTFPGRYSSSSTTYDIVLSIPNKLISTPLGFTLGLPSEMPVTVYMDTEEAGVYHRNSFKGILGEMQQIMPMWEPKSDLTVKAVLVEEVTNV